MAELVKTVYLDGRVFKPGDEVPADVAAELTNAKLWKDGVTPEQPDPDAPEQPDPDGPADEYDDWTVDELRDEVKLRNGRGADITVAAKANKADLTAALRAADAAAAA